jgi:hypothetical protein
VDRDSADDKLPAKIATAKAEAKKPGEKSGIQIRVPALPPPLQAYTQGEFLMAKPSLKLLAELERRRYTVERSNGAGFARVILPPGAPNAWEVQRELEAIFPGQSFGLNFIYKPYHAQAGVPREPAPAPQYAAKGCTAESCPWLKPMAWREALATCAADLTIGMIDTRVDENHPGFAKSKLEPIDLALKQDAAPARHWHGTGVLSVLAGKPESGTPSLIPGAWFKAVNVFFTNKNGELETDTAHLTEALDRLGEKEKAHIINMSLVGPRDELVRARIVELARKGVVFVAAAGNGGPDAPPGYPAAYEEVIAVTAVDYKGGSYDHANRGAYIDVAAPGVQIRTALPEGKQGLLSGTSFAAPFVTAVVAVAYQDSGLDRAVKAGQGSLDPKGIMLTHLFSKDQLKKRDPISGLGMIKAPQACGSQGWGSIVKLAPPARPAAPVAQYTWQPNVQRASLPLEAAR